MFTVREGKDVQKRLLEEARVCVLHVDFKW